MVNIEKKELIIASFENKVAAFAQKCMVRCHQTVKYW